MLGQLSASCESEGQHRGGEGGVGGRGGEVR